MFVQSYRPCAGKKELRKNHIITEVSGSPPAHFDRVKLHFLLKTLTKAAQERRKLVLLKPPCPSSNPAAAPMLLLKFAHKNRRRWEAER